MVAEGGISMPAGTADRMRRLGRHYIPARYPDAVTVIAAAVVGSVARGDFNVWSEVDVVVVAEELPERMPDGAALLTADAPGRVQPVDFRPDEFDAARRKGNRLAREASEAGVVMAGGDFFRQRSRSAP
jgi:predicted nucleotidyltransferase